MKPENLMKLLEGVYENKMTPQDALKKLETLPFEDLGFARLDHHRSLRNGMPEVIYSENKTPEQIITIIKKLDKSGQDILATRLSSDVYQKIKKKLPKKALYHADARLLIHQKKKKPTIGNIAIITAGTSDIPIAEEAALVAETLGSATERIYDVGVAGIHRLLDKVELIRSARVSVVVAGMEGALVSVIGGLVDHPVIGVPTSVGYGASFNGVSALLTMLNSCATGVGTVNIDNGFGAGCLAHRINIMKSPEAI